MNQSMGTLDFFLMEGGEYLERMDAISQAPAGAFAQGDEFLRLSRAFRGSAIMASQHGMARAGQGIESCARAVREGRLAWSEAARGEIIRAVDDCKVLMRRLRTPEQGDTEKAEAIGIQLDRLSGRASAQMRAAVGPGLDAGARAFVAREAASIASVLQHVARTLRGDPANRDVLVSISPAMSALRGVAVLNDLPPLADILSAIEHAAKDVMAAAGGMGSDAAEVFDAGARALARAAREVVESGRPDAEAEESHAFTARLFSALTGGGGVVSVDKLFYDDAGPHIVSQGTPPASGAGLARVEMVSHGEYLTAAAAEITRAETPVQRDLRLYGLAASIRPMMTAAGSPLANSLGKLAEAAREAIGRGAASHTIADFVQAIGQAATALSAAQSGDEQSLADRLTGVSAALATLTAHSRTRALPARPASGEQATPAAARATPVAPMVRPTPAAPAPPPPAPAPAPPVAATPAAAPAPVAGAADLATSYLTLEQLISDRGMPIGSLDELVRGGATVDAATSSRMTPPRHAAMMDPAPAAVVPVESLAPDADVVPIESLLYRGDAAWRRILELKPELTRAAGGLGVDPRLQALLSEVLDLVELGVGSGR